MKVWDQEGQWTGNVDAVLVSYLPWIPAFEALPRTTKLPRIIVSPKSTNPTQPTHLRLNQQAVKLCSAPAREVAGVLAHCDISGRAHCLTNSQTQTQGFSFEKAQPPLLTLSYFLRFQRRKSLYRCVHTSSHLCKGRLNRPHA